jgi:hypothetical protein
MSYKKPFEENFKGLFCVLRVFEKTGSLQNGERGGERGNRTLGDFVFYRCHEF